MIDINIERTKTYFIFHKIYQNRKSVVTCFAVRLSFRKVLTNVSVVAVMKQKQIRKKKEIVQDIL